jgi:NrS-1  polymerase HBD domain
VIRDRSEELHTFHARHSAEQVGEHPVSTNGHRSELTDEEVEQLARGARNSAKFEALMSGDISGYVSHSEADQAYVSLLAFYTQDEEQLDRLYRRSGLCRQKWLDRPDYRHRTITHALTNLRETYTPDDGARMVVGGDGNLVSRVPTYIGMGRGTPTILSPTPSRGSGKQSGDRRMPALILWSWPTKTPSSKRLSTTSRKPGSA